MPIGTIIGINTRGGVKKDTGEVWESTTVHYTYRVNEKGMVGLGADHVGVNLDKFNVEQPIEVGAIFLIEKDNGYLTNIEFVAPPNKLPEGK